MSKNISNLSGRIGLKDNLFKKLSENVLNDSPKDIKEIANEYNLGVSTIHGAESFYEFLRPSHREKKAFVCNGSACMCAGTQEPLKEKLKKKQIEAKNQFITCSGRLNFELVQKVLMTNIGLMIGVGAPTSLAIDLANRFDMTLIGFVKEDSFNIYTNNKKVIVG